MGHFSTDQYLPATFLHLHLYLFAAPIQFSFFILDISAKDLSGSPGLLGIEILLPPIISAILFTEVSSPLATLKISFLVECSATFITASTKSLTCIKSLVWFRLRRLLMVNY